MRASGGRRQTGCLRRRRTWVKRQVRGARRCERCFCEAEGSPGLERKGVDQTVEGAHREPRDTRAQVGTRRGPWSYQSEFETLI